MSISEIEKLWDEFANIPINIEDETEENFFWWEKGTSRFYIWHWFDEKLPNGLAVDFNLAY